MTDYFFNPTIKPSIIPHRIEGDMAEEFLREVNAKIDEKYLGNSRLKVLSLKNVNGVPLVVGSNSLILPVIEMVAPNYRTGRPEDLQRTLNDGDTLSIRGNNYIDLGVVLDFAGRNHEVALDFYEQLPKELKDFDRLPSVVIDYRLKNFDKGSYQLGLVNTPHTQVRPAKILAGGDGNFKNADVSLDNGLPIKLAGGERRLYTSSQGEQSLDNLGLSSLFLNRSLNLDSNDEDLAYSSDYGLVVLF